MRMFLLLILFLMNGFLVGADLDVERSIARVDEEAQRYLTYGNAIDKEIKESRYDLKEYRKLRNMQIEIVCHAIALMEIKSLLLLSQKIEDKLDRDCAEGLLAFKQLQFHKSAAFRYASGRREYAHKFSTKELNGVAWKYTFGLKKYDTLVREMSAEGGAEKDFYVDPSTRHVDHFVQLENEIKGLMECSRKLDGILDDKKHNAEELANLCRIQMELCTHVNYLSELLYVMALQSKVKTDQGSKGVAAVVNSKFVKLHETCTARYAYAKKNYGKKFSHTEIDDLVGKYITILRVYDIRSNEMHTVDAKSNVGEGGEDQELNQGFIQLDEERRAVWEYVVGIAEESKAGRIDAGDMRRALDMQSNMECHAISLRLLCDLVSILQKIEDEGDKGIAGELLVSQYVHLQKSAARRFAYCEKTFNHKFSTKEMNALALKYSSKLSMYDKQVQEMDGHDLSMKAVLPDPTPQSIGGLKRMEEETEKIKGYNMVLVEIMNEGRYGKGEIEKLAGVHKTLSVHIKINEGLKCLMALYGVMKSGQGKKMAEDFLVAKGEYAHGIHARRFQYIVKKYSQKFSTKELNDLIEEYISILRVYDDALKEMNRSKD